MSYSQRIILPALIAACLAAVPFHGAGAAVLSDARSIAMAGGYTAVARGCDAVWFNPANVALDGSPVFQLNLFAAGSALNNNSFSFSDYRKYNGAYISESERYDLLAKIPPGGLEFKGSAGASILSFSSGPFVLSTTAEADGRGNLSKDLVDLAFFGNAIGQTVEIDDADAGGLAHIDFNISYGRNLGRYGWGVLAAGVTVKYIKGLAYFDVRRSEGFASTGTEGLDAGGAVSILSATGGAGLGLDIGVAATRGERWTFSAGLRNALSFIDWNRETTINEYIFEITSLTAETADENSTIVSDEIERPAGTFRSSLPLSLNIGAARNTCDFLFAGDLKFVLKKAAGSRDRAEFSLGSEYRGIGFMPLRAGVSFGGFHGLSTALGWGFRVSAFHIDFAWATSGTLFPSMNNGFSIAISSGLSFMGEANGPRFHEVDSVIAPHGPSID